MKYQVRIAANAELQMAEMALWWAENRDLHQARQWLDGFERAIAALARDPQRHPRIHEHDQLDLSHTYRRLRHLAQHDLAADDLM